VTAAPVRTVFLGSGPFGGPALRVLAASPVVDLVGVVTAPPRPAGRSGRPAPTVIETTARDPGVTAILQPERLRAADAVAAVLALEPALLVLADYGQIVPSSLLEVRHGALNLHPSLLPRHRGATPVPAAILAGDAASGVTLMRMDAGLDTGPIVAQERVLLDGTETTPALEARLADLGADLLAERLSPWLDGRSAARPQDEALANLTRPFRRADGRLDVTRPAVELERQVRAMQPWPGSFLETGLGRIVVWAARVGAVAGEGTGAVTPGIVTPGIVTPGIVTPGGVTTGDGELGLIDVQPAGGRRMAWDAYLRGRPAILGSSIRP
jgi:methionyl-tRNA formyltransferase